MTDSTAIDPLDAARMRAMGFDKPSPDGGLSDQDRVEIQSMLGDRMGEYFRSSGDGYRLNTRDLAGVVADMVFAALRRDRENREPLGDRSHEEWHVFYGGPDPDNAAGRELLHDDEAEATEHLQWMDAGRGVGVARRSVHYGPWDVTHYLPPVTVEDGD